MLKLKAKTCRYCKKQFEPKTPKHIVCSADCAIAYSEKQRTKQLHTQVRMERKELREKKQALKTSKDWLPDVQKVFNRFIRLRDFDKPCISCGQYKDNPIYGTAWDCGHYLGVGARPDLRFDEKNAHKQCKSCNSGSGNHARKRYTVAQSYRINLIERIGLAEVERLEGPEQRKNYRVDDLKALKAHYQAKVKELERSA